MRPLPLSLPAAVFLCLAGPARALLDSNSDQIGDVWQARFAAGALSAAADTDANGFTNLQESILGTDPTDPSSRLGTLAALRPDGGLDLDWSAVCAKRYHPETSPDLVTWTRIKTVTGTEGPHRENVPAAGPHLFARVRAEDLDSDGDGLSDWDERAVNFNPQRVFSEGLGSNPSSPTINNPRITDFERGSSLPSEYNSPLATPTVSSSRNTIPGPAARRRSVS